MSLTLVKNTGSHLYSYNAPQKKKKKNHMPHLCTLFLEQTRQLSVYKGDNKPVSAKHITSEAMAPGARQVRHTACLSLLRFL